MNIEIDKLELFISELLIGMGLTHSDATKVAQVYKRATLRGVGHHDIHDFPQRLNALEAGLVNTTPKIKLTKKYNAMENYDGDNGLGELGCSFIMDRAQKLASTNGIGLCSIFNSNHFLAAAPYVQKAADEGYFGIIWTCSKPVMGWQGSSEKIIGNNPMGFGTPGESNPVFLDISMAYASIGSLIAQDKNNKNIPIHWAVDSEGSPTDQPSEALNGGALPIGGHKGYGLALLGELITTVMSGGMMIDEKAEIEGLFGHALHAQIAIVIKPDAFMSLEVYKNRVNSLVDYIKGLDSNFQIPGERSYKSSIEIEKNGVHINNNLKDELNKWALKYGIKTI